MKLCLFVLLVTIASASYGSSIGLFADPEFTSCNLNIPGPPWMGTFYIAAIDCAHIEGVCRTFSGAELRVEGLPSGWVTFVTPAPTAGENSGDLFGGGATITFDEYLTSDSVLLYTVTVWPAMVGAEATLRVTAWSTPNPNYNCPVARVGDCPGPTRTCVDGGMLLVNSSDACTVAVAQATWSEIKGLYH